MILLLPERAHSLVIEQLRRRAVNLTPQSSWMATWLTMARITVESQHLYGNFHMRKNAMLQAVGEASR